MEVCYFKFFAYVPISKTSKKKKNNDALRMKEEGGELYKDGKLVNYLFWLMFKKYLNASKLSKHPPFVFFTLTGWDSTISSNNIIRGCQTGTWSAG